jgi:competence CoiA-like predicted nuclease
MNKPTITDVMNLQTGEIITSINFFKMDEESIFRVRAENERYLQKGKHFLVCSLCHQPIKIRGDKRGSKTLHFAHLHSSGDCPIKTGQTYTKEEINAMKYNGVKESEEHKKLKEFIFTMLSNNKDFTNTYCEKTFKNTGLQKVWKRPDVSTRYKDKNIVFEIQLSTTFLDVIVSRQDFYYSNNTNIVWIFNKFYEDLSTLKFTEKDILYSNKNNIFILDNEMIEKSIKNKILLLKCFYLKPFRNSKNEIDFEWERKEVNVTEIIYDDLTNKSYIYNYDWVKTKLLYEDKLKKRKEIYEIIQNGIEIVEKEEGRGYNWNLSNVLDSNIFDNFLPFTLSDLIKVEEIVGFIFTILFYDTKKAKLYEARYRNSDGYFIQLLNHMISYKKEYMDLILRAIDFYEKRKLILDNDKKGTFRKKLIDYKINRPEQNHYSNNVLQYLFPELFFNMGIPN